MSEVIIPKPGHLYNEFFCQGSDGNYYVKKDGVWIKVEGGAEEKYKPFDPRAYMYCPIANKGERFIVVGANGRFGGSNGPEINPGDLIICYEDNKIERPWNGDNLNPDSSFIIVEKNLGSIKNLIENTPLSTLSTTGELEIMGNVKVANTLNVPYSRIFAERCQVFSHYERKIAIVNIPISGHQMDGHYDYIRINEVDEEGASLTLFSLQNVYNSIETIIHNNTIHTIRVWGYWHLGDTIEGERNILLNGNSSLKLFGKSNGNFSPGEWYIYY